MKKIHIAASPLTGKIFIGHILKEGIWAADKQDITLDALVAVAGHVVKFGKPVEITNNGIPEYRITVEKLSA